MSKIWDAILTMGGVSIVLFGLIALFSLASCGQQPNELKEQSLAALSQGKTPSALFKKEAQYGDCEVGSMEWYGSLGYAREAKVIICKGQPSTSVTYRNGKVEESALMVGTASTKEMEEQLQREQEQLAKKQKCLQAIGKLTDEEKALLNPKC